MKILINENKSDAIIGYINKHGFLDTLKMLGGVNTFKKISNHLSGLNEYVNDYLTGRATMMVMGDNITYEFDILDFRINDIGGMEVLSLIVNLLVDFNNLSEFEINEYKKFLILTSETLEFDIEISDKLTEGYECELIIKEINSESTDDLKKSFNSNDVISDDEINDIINKTKIN